MGKTIVVASGKGGVGKTSIVAGVASCLAKLGKTVVCVDADIGLRNLDLALGLYERTVFDFTDVLGGRTPLDDALAAHPEIENLYVLAAPIRQPEAMPRAEAFNGLINELKSLADFVFVDSPAGLGLGFQFAAGSCESAIIATTPNQLAIRDAARCAERLSSHTDSKIIVNRVQPRLIRLKHAQTIDEIMDTIGLPLLGVVPEDDMVTAAQNHNVPIILAAPDGAASAFCDIADRLNGNACPLPNKIKELRVRG